MKKQPPTSNYTRLKAERERQLQEKENTIKTVLESAKNRLKFIHLIQYCLNSIEKFISPPNREIRINAKIIIRLEGVGILRAIALVNSSNIPIVEQTGEIMWKLISVYDIIDTELALLFAENKGHESVIDILCKKENCDGTKFYLKVINGLCSIPQLVHSLIDAGLPQTIKIINEKYSDDMNIITANFEAMKKISFNKNGRKNLFNEIGNILKNLKSCALYKNIKGILNGFLVLENICKDDEGREMLIKEKPMKILTEILDQYNNDEKILSEGAKLYAKISSEDDMKEQLEKMKNCLEKLKKNISKDNINELKEPSILVSNLMLVENLCRIAIEKNNLKMIIELFEVLYKVDLNGKDNEFIDIYIRVMKNFMIIFQRIFSNIDCNEFFDLIDEIEDLIQKIFNEIKNKNDENIINSFRNYFISYVDLLIQNYNNKNEKENEKFIKLIEYIINNIISNGEKYFGKNENANYAASQILKLSYELINKGNYENLEKEILNTFSYIKSIILVIENYKTLENILKICNECILNNKNKDQKKNNEEFIPIIVEFMINKFKYRSPNKINLEILNNFFTQDFLSEYLKQNNKSNEKNIYNINYTEAINNVMSGKNYVPLHKKKDDEENEDEIIKETYDENLEKEISTLGSELLKKVINMKDFLKEVQIFKTNASKISTLGGNEEDYINLEKNIVYQQCAITIKEFLDAGGKEDLDIIETLIKKEINEYEKYKRNQLQATDQNYKDYQKNCLIISKRIKLELSLVSNILNSAIKNYNETNDEKYLDLIRQINQLYIEIIEKSSDNMILCEIIEDIQKSIPFMKKNIEQLKTKRGENIIEKYINSLLNLIRKTDYEDEKLFTTIIKTFITFTNEKKETCNFLVKAGCPRQLLLIMESTNNIQLVSIGMELLKILTFSNQENLIMIANQNILLKLFEIRAKFSNDENITHSCDLISNEILKLPGQEDIAQNVISETIVKFHEDSQKNFEEEEIRNKLLSDLEILNAFSSNKKQVEFLINDEFISDLNLIMNKTLKSNLMNRINEKLLINEITILNKIKDNLKDDDNRHEVIINNIINISKRRDIYSDSLIMSVKILSDYTKNDTLYQKYLSKKIDEKFIDEIFETIDYYSEDIEISKTLNVLLCNISLKNPKLGEYIVKKGGLNNILEELRSTVNLNDENSKKIKFNSLKMLETLLKDNKNMDKFIKEHGVDLLNTIIKNEVNFTKNLNQDSNDDLFKTNKPDKNQIINNDEDYCLECIKIFNNGILEKKKEFVEGIDMKNILTLSQIKYNKNTISEISSILNNNKINYNEDLEKDMKLIKFILSAKGENLIEEKINKENEETMDLLLKKISKNTFSKDEYKKLFKSAISKDEEFIEMNKKMSYLSLASDTNEFNEITKENKNEISKFYNSIITMYQNQLDSYEQNSQRGSIKNLPFDQSDIITLIKLTNYLISNDIVEPKEEYINLITDISNYYYNPKNYLFVQILNQQMKTLLDKYGKDEEIEEDLSNNNPTLKSTKYKITYLKKVHSHMNQFIDDYKNDLDESKEGEIPKMNSIKIDNFNDICNSISEYYRNNPNIENINEENENNEIQINKPKTIIRKSLNIIDTYKNKDLSKYAEEEGYEEEYKTSIKTIKNLFRVIKSSLQASPDILTNESNTELIKEIIDKIDESIKYPNINKTELKTLINKIAIICKDNDIIAERILQFLIDDTMRCNDENIRTKNLEIILKLSENPTILNQIVKNEIFWSELKEIYSDKKNIKNPQRKIICEIFKNITNSNYNVSYLINNDPIFFTIITNELKNEKNNDDNEIDIVTNVIRDSTNYKILLGNKILKESDLDEMENKYKSSSSNAFRNFKSVAKKLKEENESPLNKEENDIKKDEESIKKYTEIINKAYKEHMNELQKYSHDEKQSLKGKKENENKNKDDVVKISSSIIKRQVSIITGTLLYNNENNLKIKSNLSIKNNSEMNSILEKLHSIIRKNYSYLNNSKNEELNKKRRNIINECFNLLKTLSVCPDNHRTILECGLISFIENLPNNDLNNEESNKILYNDENVRLFNKNSKNVLQDCSNSEITIPIIIDSPIMKNLTNEIVYLYENPNELSNEDIQKIFLYDNIIFSNICKNEKGFEEIFNSLGFDNLISLGKKTGNVILLDAIMSMLINYLVGIENKNSLPDSFWGDALTLINKCFELNDRNPSLISKTQKCISLMWLPKLIPYFDKINILKKINENFENFYYDKDYLNSLLNCLSIITANNSRYSKECVSSGLITKLKDEVTKLDKDENYYEMIFNLTKLYSSLVINNIENIEAFSEMGITANILYFIKNFEPLLKAPEEKEQKATFQNVNFLNKNSVISQSRYDGDDDDLVVIREEKNEEDSINNPLSMSVSLEKSIKNYNKNKNPLVDSMTIKRKKSKNGLATSLVLRNAVHQSLIMNRLISKDLDEIKEQKKMDFIRGILENSIKTIDHVTISKKSNGVLSKMNFSEIIKNSLKNKNHSIYYITTALHSFGNFLYYETGENIKKINLDEIHNLLKIIQRQFYSNSNILANINYISGVLLRNINANDNENDYIIKFFTLINESNKCQDWNNQLVLMSLRYLLDGINKHTFLCKDDFIFSDTVPNLFNLLDIYKDNIRVQVLIYKILCHFANGNEMSHSMIKQNNLFLHIKESLNNITFNLDIKSKSEIRKVIYDLLEILSNNEKNCKSISDDLIDTLLQEIENNKSNSDEENCRVAKLISKLLSNNNCIQNFIQYNGIERISKTLSEEDDSDTILELLRILTILASQGNEYKIKMKNLNVPDIINSIIEKMGIYEKMIEYEGRCCIFLINMAEFNIDKIQDVDLNDIKVVTPVEIDIRDFLSDGEMVNLIKQNGEISKVHLYCDEDLEKIYSKERLKPIDNNYTIDIENIDQIIGGPYDESFILQNDIKIIPENCFTVTDKDGKILCVVCDDEDSAEKWITCLEIVVSYIRNTKKDLTGRRYEWEFDDGYELIATRTLTKTMTKSKRSSKKKKKKRYDDDF